MLFTNTLAVAASFIAAVSGATLPSHIYSRQNNGTTNGTAPAAPPAYFQLMALRSASPVHFSRFQAAKSSVFLQLPSQNATCDDREADDAATFYLSDDGGLYLYAASATPQQLYADRSGMGQGKFGYTTGAQPAPRNGERTGFTIDQYGDLTLEGAGFLACPNSIEGSWAIWVSAGIANPAGNTDCLGVSVRAVEVTKPNSCTYTS
ncbi:cell wall protein [Colletotrichum incanum]|uniref:Cell wall protein n=1 Tax=Colletotrichum incanum TaxID=1573173 RepID=A0A161Y0I8_COLIC|nr:cell wall protein [Colletotrichum incanum]OHW95214.1 PhiA cell wall protein [Colletotrichum incanum]